MTERRAVGNLLALAVLAYLTQGPLHPYELGRTLQRNGDARNIRYRHASLYMVVEQLARAGFVVPAGSDRDGARPERTRYALTDAGRTELATWMRHLIAEPAHEYPQFVAALSLIGALPPDEVAALLGRRLAALSRQRAEAAAVVATAEADGVHPLFLVEEEYRTALIDAEAAFCERLRARVAGPDGEWRSAWQS